MKCLRGNLLTFPALSGREGILIQDRHTLALHHFDEYEHFLLDALRVPYSDAAVAARHKEQFGVDLSISELKDFIAKLDSLGLLEETDGPGHPGESEMFPEAALPPSRPESEQTAAIAEQPPVPRDDNGSPQNETDGKRRFRNHWSLFDPTTLLNTLARWLLFTRHLAFLAPFIFAMGAAGLAFNWPTVKSDLQIISVSTTLLEHVLFSLLTTSLLTQVTRGIVARHFGLATPSFGLTFVLGVMPRFSVRLEIPEHTPRHTRLWLAATPLLVRLLLFQAGVTLWLAMRTQGTTLPLFGLALALLSMISFLFVANPLLGGSGYQWISAYYNSPRLREKAFRALRYWFRKPPDAVARYLEDSPALRVYALASITFMVGFVGFLTLTLATWLELHYSGLGVIVSVLLTGYIYWNLHRRLVPVRGGRGRHKSGRSDTARPKRAGQAVTAQPTGIETPGGEDAEHTPRPGWQTRLRAQSWRRYLLPAILAVVAFLPYRYEPGGSARVVPMSAQQIYAQYSGIVEEVFYQGGEQVAAGAIIATMSSFQQQRDIDVTRAQINSKEAQLRTLLSTPTAEQISVAEEELRTAEVRLKYATNDVARLRNIFDKGAISYVSFEEAQQGLDIARQEVNEKRAGMDAIKKQVNPNDIDALTAELDELRAKLHYHREVLERTVLRMPFDGTITTMNLANLKNKYFEDGDLFAEIEDRKQIKVEIAISETDIEYVVPGAEMHVKLVSFPAKTLVGEISSIYPTSSEMPFGAIVTVVGLIDNPADLLKSGMTGYAKVAGTEMYVIQSFTRALMRFFQVEVWSWLP